MKPLLAVLKKAFLNPDRNRVAAAMARRWTLSIVAVFILIKLGLLATESSIKLKPWEWVFVPFATTYQHVLMALPIFLFFFVLFLGSTLGQKSRIMTLGIAGLFQVVATFLHIAALRVVHVLGSYPTFEMTEADSEGSVFAAQLFAAQNLVYVVPGVLLAALAIAVPILLKRASFIPRHRPLVKIFAGLVLWLILGAASERGISSFFSVANADPGLFYVSDFVEKRFGVEWLNTNKKGDSFSTRSVLQTKEVVRTKHLFKNLDTFRATNMNVVLVVLESLPVKQASFMRTVKEGNQVRNTTPTLRRLRRNMLTFENHYTVHPSSMNSLFSIGCSLYPFPGGGTITSVNPRIPCRSISEVFKGLGYKTGLFHSGKFSFWKKKKFFKKRGFNVMRDAKNMPGRKRAKKFHWGIDEFVTARTVSNFITRNQKNSFFVQYLVLFPHAPYEYLHGDYAIFPKKKKKDKYHNSLRYVDAAVKLIVDQVKKLNLLDETLFVFVGDHGEAFLEHPGNRVHSIYIYEENVHVPLAFYNPILFPKNASSKRVTSHIDILPTIADLVGASRGRHWQGTSFLKDSAPSTAYFFANFGQRFLGLRDGRFKVIWNKKKNKFQVYDLKRDRRERTSIVDRMQNKLPQYRRSLNVWEAYHTKMIRNLGKR